MRIVVDFPAPFGPRKPKTSPFSTVKETSLTAWSEPKSFLRLLTVSIWFLYLLVDATSGL
jgi:hypothetical protein